MTCTWPGQHPKCEYNPDSIYDILSGGYWSHNWFRPLHQPPVHLKLAWTPIDIWLGWLSRSLDLSWSYSVKKLCLKGCSRSIDLTAALPVRVSTQDVNCAPGWPLSNCRHVINWRSLACTNALCLKTCTWMDARDCEKWSLRISITTWLRLSMWTCMSLMWRLTVSSEIWRGGSNTWNRHHR